MRVIECWKSIYWCGEGAETMPDMRSWYTKLWRGWLATTAAIPCSIMLFFWK